MKKKTLRILGRTGCLSLAALIALSAPASVYASAAGTRKDETVYVNLDSAGTIQKTIVSDWLHSDDPTQRITDKSDLKGIQNVKTNEKSIQQGDTLSWVLNTDNSGKNIYYQGTTDKKTPLEISMAYTLDGKTVSASEIAGKSGKVTVSLTLKNTEAQTVNVNGKDVTMYTPMTAIAAAVLPSATFKNVSVNSGKVLTDGNNQFVTFLSMPGLSDSLGLKDSEFTELSSLDLPETLTIEADAVNFTLPSIMIGATPKLVDADKLSSSGSINKLVDSLKNLKKLQDDLNNVDPNKDISSLMTNPDRTAAAKLLVDDVFDFYGLDTSAATLLPKYVNDNTFALADKVTSDLTKADLKYLVDNHVLDNAAASFSKVDMQKAGALMNDYAALSTFDASKLNGASKLLSDSAASSGSLSKLLADASGLMGHVDANSIQVVGALTNSSVQNDLTATLKSLDALNGAATTAHVPANFTADSRDVQAYLVSYLKRNLGSLAAQTIDAHAVNGKITVGGLSTIMSGLGLGDAQRQGLVTQMCRLNPSLAAAFGPNDPNAVVSAADIETTLGAILSGMSDSDLTQLVTPLAQSMAGSLTDPINKLLTNSSKLQGSLTATLGSSYVNKLTDAMSATTPSLQSLTHDFTTIAPQDGAKVAATMQDAQALLGDQQTLAYLGQWAQQLPAMQNDLKANSDNIAALQELMKAAQDSRLQKSLASLPALRSDLNSVSSVAASMQSDLKRSGVSTSRSSLTNTMNTLLKMRTDVNNSRNIMNIFRQATSANTVSVFREALAQADSLQSDSSVNSYLGKIDNAEDLLARKDEYLKLADQHQIFSQAADGASTSVKFVYKTAEIKKPVVKAVAHTNASAQTQNAGGIGGWFQNLFNNIRNLFHF